MGFGVNRASSYKGKKLSIYVITLDPGMKNRRFVQFAESISFLAVCSVRGSGQAPHDPGN